MQWMNVWVIAFLQCRLCLNILKTLDLLTDKVRPYESYSMSTIPSKLLARGCTLTAAILSSRGRGHGVQRAANRWRWQSGLRFYQSTVKCNLPTCSMRFKAYFLLKILWNHFDTQILRIFRCLKTNRGSTPYYPF